MPSLFYSYLVMMWSGKLISFLVLLPVVNTSSAFLVSLSLPFFSLVKTACSVLSNS